MNVRMKNQQFQVGLMSNPGLNMNKAFKEQVGSNTELTFDLKTMIPTRKLLREEKSHVISLLIFYKTRKIMMYKVLGSLVHCTIENYFYLYYLCLQQAELYLASKISENTKFNEISGIVIPELLMNIMSCHGFMNEKKLTVMLSCCRKLVKYYLSKSFVVIENNSNVFRDVPLRVKQRINALIWHKHYFSMAYYRSIPYSNNTIKIITICSVLYRDFASTYYNDKENDII